MTRFKKEMQQMLTEKYEDENKRLAQNRQKFFERKVKNKEVTAMNYRRMFS